MGNMSVAVATDLSRSGLEIGDIRAREIGTPEAAAIGLTGEINGYVIPYYGFDGNPIPFYRVRLFGQRVRYLQPKNTANHIYFPLGLKDLLDSRKDTVSKTILICEGEKKALCAVKNGIPAIGLGGVDSWRNRTTVLPLGSELFKIHNKKDGADVAVRLPAGHESIEEMQEAPLAIGFTQLVNYMARYSITAVIAFDSDEAGATKFEVQRAASALGFELRYMGMAYKNVRQLILPVPQSWRVNSGNGSEESEELNQKVGVDDYILSEGAGKFIKLIETTLESNSAFPTHPNVRDFVNKRLSKKKLSRKEAQQVAMAILCDLDSKGNRLKSFNEDQTYYFDFVAKRLLKVAFNTPSRGLLHETSFGQLLYNRYGISAADQRILTWLDAQFNAEQPLEDVKPAKVFAVPQGKENFVTLQLSDSEYVRVNGDNDKLEIFDNGSGGILFEGGHVRSIDTDLLREELDKQEAKEADGPIPCWWNQVLANVRLRGDMQTQTAIALMYYISPWLTRWRGTQLPVELVIGEAGSGKSSLCELRLDIITGQPDLRNAPIDLKDWHASIVGSGGLHVTDNLQLVDKQLRQRLSDELCRLVTEPYPHVEMRKLYSNAELIKLPVAVSFAITSIQQPFNGADILQRSFLVELDKGRFGDDILYDNTWVDQMLQTFGGREAWLAHHLRVLQRFFRVVKEQWQPRYRATHRLINVEQSLKLLGPVFGMDTSWIPAYLGKTEARAVSEADWTMEGLIAYKSHMVKLQKDNTIFAVREISEWCLSQEDFVDCIQLTNPRKLGRHIKLHAQLIKSLTGIVECGTRANRTVYHITQP